MAGNQAGTAAFHGPGRTWTRECGCGAQVTVTGVAGPSNMCDGCAGALVAFIHGEPGAEMPPGHRFPLDQPVPVSCGLRADLPKKQRVHRRVYLGTDPRHTGDGGIEELHIFACAVCGADKQTRTPPGNEE